MKALAAASIALILASCTGETTVIREVQVTSAPIETTAPAPSSSPERLSRAEAISSAQSYAPSLRLISNATIESLMMTACESIDTWAPDYSGYLRNAQTVLADESSIQRDEINAIVVAAIYSVCTEHQIGIVDALDKGIYGY